MLTETQARSARRSMLPPMLCDTDLARVAASPAAYAWDVKWDGHRGQLQVAAAALWSRNAARLEAAFPEAGSAAVGALGGRDVVLDCELVVLDDAGRPDFAALSARSRLRRPFSVRGAAAAAPALLVAFDVLVLDGEDLRRMPWEQRRARLDGLGLPAGVPTRTPGLVAPPAWDDGLALLEATGELRLEGVVAKHRQAPYVAGRAHHWIKLSPLGGFESSMCDTLG